MTTLAFLTTMMRLGTPGAKEALEQYRKERDELKRLKVIVGDRP